MKLFSSKLKKLLFFLEPLRVFHHHRFSLLFSGVFIADCICSLHHCFFRCFYFTTDFTIVFSSVFILPTFFTVTVFLSVTSFCVAVLRVLRIWESFFLFSGLFYLILFPDIWHNLLFYQGFRRAGSSALKVVAGPPTDFRNTDPAHLFESHSVQQKVLVGRFYLCIKALRNTM